MLGETLRTRRRWTAGMTDMKTNSTTRLFNEIGRIWSLNSSAIIEPEGGGLSFSTTPWR